MTVESSLVMPGGIAQERSRDHRFFTGMALACALTVFIGFAPTYYLRVAFDGPPVPTALVHLHGMVFTGWILLFIAQTSLVAAGRTDLHRRLGVAGAALVVALLVVGWFTAIEAARRGVTPPGGPPPLAFLSVPIGTLMVFAILVVAGLANRRRSDHPQAPDAPGHHCAAHARHRTVQIFPAGRAVARDRRYHTVRPRLHGIRPPLTWADPPRVPVGWPVPHHFLAGAVRGRRNRRLGRHSRMADAVTR
jgi:hypothetical protein